MQNIYRKNDLDIYYSDPYNKLLYLFSRIQLEVNYKLPPLAPSASGYVTKVLVIFHLFNHIHLNLLIH